MTTRKDGEMTAGERRKARKAAKAAGQPLTGDLALTGEARPGLAPIRTGRQERQHAAHMYRWARRYDALNGAPENDDDR